MFALLYQRLVKMTNMSQSIAFLLLVLSCKQAFSSVKEHCGMKYYFDANDTINAVLDDIENPVSCTWLVIPPAETITTVRILESETKNCTESRSCCLSFTGQPPICNENINKPSAFSFRTQPLTIKLNASSPIEVNFDYTSRTAQECPHSDFGCLDKSNCYNSTDICRKKLICKDNSDKRGCGKCSSNSTWCGVNSDFCFNLSDRCNGVLNCPKGDDELSCFKDCPGIKCPNENKCIKQNQLCDNVIDCESRFDEANCVNVFRKNSVNSVNTVTASQFFIASFGLFVWMVHCLMTIK